MNGKCEDCGGNLASTSGGCVNLWCPSHRRGDAIADLARLRAENERLTAEVARLHEAESAAMALVLSHEGHIARLTAEVARLREDDKMHQEVLGEKINDLIDRIKQFEDVITSEVETTHGELLEAAGLKIVPKDGSELPQTMDLGMATAALLSLQSSGNTRLRAHDPARVEMLDLANLWRERADDCGRLSRLILAAAEEPT
jgi:hypothetical protein